MTFVPEAVCLSSPHTRLWNFLMWIRRQVLLVKLPDPLFYLLGVFLGLVYLLAYVACGVLLLVPGERFGLTLPLAGIVLLGILTTLRAWARYHLAHTLLVGREAEVKRTLSWTYYFFVPIADLLMFPVYISVLFQQAIRWRGVTYRWVGDHVECEQIRGTVLDE